MAALFSLLRRSSSAVTAINADGKPTVSPTLGGVGRPSPIAALHWHPKTRSYHRDVPVNGLSPAVGGNSGLHGVGSYGGFLAGIHKSNACHYSPSLKNRSY